MLRVSSLSRFAGCVVICVFLAGCPGILPNGDSNEPPVDNANANDNSNDNANANNDADDNTNTNDASTNGTTPNDNANENTNSAGDASGGHAAAGATLFADNGCAGCHGADGSGGVGPSLAGVSTSTLDSTLRDPATTHTGGEFLNLTDGDLADLAAFLATGSGSTDVGSSGIGQGTPPADHTEPQGAAGVLHKPGLLDPLTNCTACHGADLQGTVDTPSCTLCHGELWASDALALHTDTLTAGSISGRHAPGRDDPAANCAGCHGSDLFGSGDAPACWSCHGSIWDGPPNYPPTHTRIEEGFHHAPGLSSPIGNCDACHGANLTGTALIPSCYTCHGAAWNGEEDDD